MRNLTLAPNWSWHRLEEVVESTQLGTAERGVVNGEGSVDLIKMGNLDWGAVKLSTIEQIDKQLIADQKQMLRAGDIIFNTRNSLDLVGKSAVWPDRTTPALPDNNINILRLKDIVDPHYLCAYMNFGFGKSKVRALAAGSTSVAAIYWKDLRNYRFPCPPITEQRKIVSILRTWDEVVEKVGLLIRVKEKAFAHLALSLFSTHGRSAPTRPDWRSVSLTDVTTELTARNGNRLGSNSVMGVSKFEGMIPMKDHVRASDLSRYKIVAERAFAYNPMRINIGSIAMNKHGRDVLVSPDYVAFSTNDCELDADYFDHLRRTRMWSHFVENAGSGGVRTRIYYNDLADFSFFLPPFEEQQKIASILDTSRREIILLKTQCDAFDRQKQGLMQKLLAGKWAMKLESGHG